MRGRVTAFGSVAVLVAAAGLAAALSAGSTAGQVLYPPPPAGDPVASAAAGAAAEVDLSSRSFVGDVSLTTHRVGLSGTESYTLVYQAPDRSELIPPSPAGGTLITIGDIGYAEDSFSASGRGWFYYKVPRGEPTGARMATVYLEIFLHNPAVVFTPGGYQLVVVTTVPPGQARLPLNGAGEEETVATASLKDGRIASEVVTFHMPRSSSTIRVRYKDFGSAPAIPTPAGAQKAPTLP